MLTNPEPRSRHLSLTSRRALIVLAASLAVLVQFAISPQSSRADDSQTLTIVGTSDVSDSGLSTVLTRDFTKYYDTTQPGAISVGYVGMSSQNAIGAAEAGNGSALLVHAASLENQFVKSGFSEEKYGRAVFDGDFVLLGPKSDPAHVLKNDPHNIVGAFEAIAAAGGSSKANFVSRNDGSGTNVQEHKIWSMTTGVTTCTVSTANGGFTMPSTSSGACPKPKPAWYQESDVTQGENVQITNTCNFSSGPNDCYTLTDRGTFDNLENQGAIPNLKVVTEDNSPNAPGGNTLLVNSFHAYAVNPSKVPGQVNLPAAKLFLKWLTSPAGQDDVNSYLANAPGGAPFRKDAAPILSTSTKLPKTTHGGRKLTIKGTLRNVVTGAPYLNGVKVTLSALRNSVAATNPHATPVPVATATTNSTGRFAFHYRPKASSRYTLSTGEITKIEDATLNPVFGDLLAPASKSLGVSRIRPSVTIEHVTSHHGQVAIAGEVAPSPTKAFAHISLYAARGHRALKYIGRRRLTAGRQKFLRHFHLPAGHTYRIRLKYVNDGQTKSGTSATRTVTVH